MGTRRCLYPGDHLRASPNLNLILGSAYGVGSPTNPSLPCPHRGGRAWARANLRACSARSMRTLAPLWRAFYGPSTGLAGLAGHHTLSPGVGVGRCFPERAVRAFFALSYAQWARAGPVSFVASMGAWTAGLNANPIGGALHPVHIMT